MTARKYLRSQDAAEYLGVPLETLRHWRKGSAGPKGAKIGQHVVYRVTDLDAWVEQQFAKAGAR